MSGVRTGIPNGGSQSQSQTATCPVGEGHRLMWLRAPGQPEKLALGIGEVVVEEASPVFFEARGADDRLVPLCRSRFDGYYRLATRGSDSSPSDEQLRLPQLGNRTRGTIQGPESPGIAPYRDPAITIATVIDTARARTPEPSTIGWPASACAPVARQPRIAERGRG